MKYGYIVCLALLLVSCQTSQPPQPQQSRSIWYTMELNDAMAGAVVKDNDTLVEWSGNPDIERTDYLQGYQMVRPRYVMVNAFMSGEIGVRIFPPVAMVPTTRNNCVRHGKRAQTRSSYDH